MQDLTRRAVGVMAGDPDSHPRTWSAERRDPVGRHREHSGQSADQQCDECPVEKRARGKPQPRSCVQEEYLPTRGSPPPRTWFMRVHKVRYDPHSNASKHRSRKTNQQCDGFDP